MAIKRTLISAALVAAAFGAQAAPIDCKLNNSEVGDAAIADPISLAILSGLPDIDVISAIRQWQQPSEGNPDGMVISSYALTNDCRGNGDISTWATMDPWMLLQQRKEALVTARRILIPLNTMEIDQSAAPGWLGRSNDVRDPRAMTAAGNYLGCSPKTTDHIQFCVELQGVSTKVNNPDGMWIKGTAFAPFEAKFKSVWNDTAGFTLSSHPIYAVVATITDRKPDVLDNKAYIKAHVDQAVILDSQFLRPAFVVTLGGGPLPPVFTHDFAVSNETVATAATQAHQQVMTAAKDIANGKVDEAKMGAAKMATDAKDAAKKAIAENGGVTGIAGKLIKWW